MRKFLLMLPFFASTLLNAQKCIEIGNMKHTPDSDVVGVKYEAINGRTVAKYKSDFFRDGCNIFYIKPADSTSYEAIYMIDDIIAKEVGVVILTATKKKIIIERRFTEQENELLKLFSKYRKNLK